jgi:hypothetical protein
MCELFKNKYKTKKSTFMPITCFTTDVVDKRTACTDFAKNQLSLSLIGLSPLILDLLCILQHTKVRPICLSKIRSPSFGLNLNNLI